jgi:hypothetical protein
MFQSTLYSLPAHEFVLQGGAHSAQRISIVIAEVAQHGTYALSLSEYMQGPSYTSRRHSANCHITNLQYAPAARRV